MAVSVELAAAVGWVRLGRAARWAAPALAAAAGAGWRHLRSRWRQPAGESLRWRAAVWGPSRRIPAGHRRVAC